MNPLTWLRAQFRRFGDWAIAKAMATPYVHLDGYMDRWWLFRLGGRDKLRSDDPFIAARVHHILRSDNDRHFHDHPWPFVTIILRGGYTEVRPVLGAGGVVIGERRRWYGPGSILFRRARSWHRLELAKSAPGLLHADNTAWTLFFMGPRLQQQWGFLTSAGKVPSEYYEAACELHEIATAHHEVLRTHGLHFVAGELARRWRRMGAL